VQLVVRLVSDVKVPEDETVWADVNQILRACFLVRVAPKVSAVRTLSLDVPRLRWVRIGLVLFAQLLSVAAMSHHKNQSELWKHRAVFEGHLGKGVCAELSLRFVVEGNMAACREVDEEWYVHGG
jgi:hypothetical protein